MSRIRFWISAPIFAALMVACTPPSTGSTNLPPIIPPTTRVSDTATRTALSAYDPNSGTMRFAGDTPLLSNLKLDDVLVSEPSTAAPNGYLRKVKAIRKEGNEVVLETTQAALTDAISQGSLDAKGDLEIADLQSATALVKGVTVGVAPQVDVGDGFKFQARFDETVLDINEGDVKVKVRVSGGVYFNAGYNVGVGIDGPSLIPPKLPSIDRFEAWVGFEQRSDLRVSGEANAKITREKKVAEYRFKPKCFFIGPVPVCIVPTIYVLVGAGGEVNLHFDYAALQTAQAKIGAKWTDDKGWEKFDPLPKFEATFNQNFVVNAALKAHAFARSEAALMLYGVAGPTLGVKASLELDAAIPRNPLWILRGSLEGYYSFIVDLPVFGRVAESRDSIFSINKEFGRSPNTPPKLELTGKSGRVEQGLPVQLGPGGCNRLGSFFYIIADLEDGCAITVTLVSNRDGNLPFNHTFQSEGLRDITVTARDTNGASVSKSFTLNVVNPPPLLTLQYFGDPFQGEDHPFAVLVTDVNEALATNMCNNTTWSVDAPDVLSASTGCTLKIKFGTTGARQVRVNTKDSQGATASRNVSVNVLPPPPNPYPRILSYGMYSWRKQPTLGLCANLLVASGGTIDLREKGCTDLVGQPSPPKYSAQVVMENPSGETLSYDWRIFATDQFGNYLISSAIGSSSNEFTPTAGGNASLSTADCFVTVKVNAPDPARSKTVPVWAGKCTYYASTVN